jgi:hypothetical protein
MVWEALVLLLFFAVLKAFLFVIVFVTIRDDQAHEVNGVPSALWVLAVVSAVSAVLDAILGIFIFRGSRWAWITALVLVVAGVIVGVAVIAMSSGGASITGLIPDLATLGVILNRNVREWCSGSAGRTR